MKDEETSEKPAPESLADIQRDMEADAEAAWEGTPLRRALVKYAARLREALDAPALATGNAAALREALEKVHKAFCDGLIGAHCIATDAEALFRLWHTEIPAALSAPPRNCDRFATADKAIADSSIARAADALERIADAMKKDGEEKGGAE